MCINTHSYAQSAAALEHAGDHSMQQKDPYAAISFYTQSNTFNTSASLSYKIAEAYNMLHDYPNALFWYNSATTNAGNDHSLLINAILKSAELLKCLGRFKEAEQLLLMQKEFAKTDSIRLNKILHGIKYAEQLNSDSISIQVNHTGEIINSPYSEVAPTALGDSVIYFSSMRFFTKSKTENKKLTSKILVSKIENNTFATPEIVSSMINSPKFNNANPSISPDHKLMIFNRCLEDDENNLICTLWESKYKDKQWQSAVILPDNINLPKYTSTQPCITTNGNEGYLLFYSSDCPNGYGKHDIWLVKRNPEGAYSTPLNAGALINSTDEEVTPFYDAMTDTLYFSSDREDGLGGFDLLATSYKNKIPQKTVHPGPPINSGYNDLYYTANYAAPRSRYLVSNRPPAKQLNEGTCCYDIFNLKDIPIVKKDSVVQISTISIISLPLDQIPLDSISHLPVDIIMDKLSTLLPLRLYFDNDFPDPRTRKSITSSIFDGLTSAYLQKLPEYQNAHKKDTLEQQNLKTFFNDSVAVNFLKLGNFTAVIYELLQSGHRLQLKLQGCASPLADNAYNLTLSERRISSLKNYWQHWNTGKLKEYIQSEMFVFYDNPAGEQLATNKVSDRLDNKAASVYSVSAALERRIEVTEISLQKP